MNRCKHCVGSKCVKNGFANEKQRYKCKDCGKSYRDGDLREKYSIERKLSVISMYLEGVGIRSIERLEKISSPHIIKWIRRFSHILRQKLNQTSTPENSKD